MNPLLQFILICAAVVVGLLLLAWLYEHFFVKNRLRLSSPKYIATVGICGALAGLLMLLEFPLLFLAPEFYKVDFSELPALICGFYLGPVAGVLTEVLKILVKLAIKGSATAGVGELANFAVGCALVLPASMIYHAKKSKAGAIIGLSVGTLFMTVFGSLFNAVYLIPAFAELYAAYGGLNAILGAGAAINGAIHDVPSFVFICVLPLNLLKGTVISILTFLLYKRVEKLLFKRN